MTKGLVTNGGIDRKKWKRLITKGNEAVPISKVESHISDICSHYTGWLFVSSPKLIWYSMIIALLFWFRFTDSWRAKEIKTSSTLIYCTSKKDV